MLLLFVLLCALSTSFAAFPDCVNGPLSTSLICDPRASLADRSRDFVSKLTSAEKITRLYSAFDDPSPAIERLGIPSIQLINDALHGLTTGPNFKFDGSGPYNSSTAFPAPINFAATFNDRLTYGLGSSIAVEARAFTNAGRGGIDLWTPNINPFRDPRWGRGQETPGEDPFVGRRYALNFVQGMQGGADPRYYKAAANCKHFVAYDLENWGGTDRVKFDAQVSMKELVEYHFPAFETCIRDARAASIMCSYNSLNGVPTCASEYLLQKVSRDFWNFKSVPGNIVLSDCDAVANAFDSHHYRADPVEVVALALRAGMDLNCGPTYRNLLPFALQRGLITEADLDVAVTRVTENLIASGYFDPPAGQLYRQFGPEHVNAAEAQSIAYQAAVQSQVLLKNTGVLPINPSSTTKIAVVGPLSADAYFIQGNYRGKPPFVIDIVQGLQGNGPEILNAHGTEVASSNTGGFQQAIDYARSADYTIYVGGLTEDLEKETGDRTSLKWPGVQAELMDKIAEASKAPIIVLAIGGGQIDMTAQRDDPRIGAIIFSGYPAQFAGKAVADIVFGRVSPSGRLVSTSYPADYVSLSMQDMNLRPGPDNPGRTYMWYSGKPVYEFGKGLSYTSFAFDLQSKDTEMSIDSLIASAKSWSAANGKDASAAPLASYSASVTNTGNVTSSVSALLFLKSDVPDTPKQQLVSYAFVENLAPGSKQSVNFDLTMHSIAKVDEMGDRYLVPGVYTLFVGYADHPESTIQVRLAGDKTLVQEFPRP